MVSTKRRSEPDRLQEIKRIIGHEEKNNYVTYTVERYNGTISKVSEKAFETRQKQKDKLRYYKKKVSGQTTKTRGDWEVNEILAHRMVDGNVLYLISWVGWRHAVWNSEHGADDLENCKEILKEYWERNDKVFDKATGRRLDGQEIVPEIEVEDAEEFDNATDGEEDEMAEEEQNDGGNRDEPADVMNEEVARNVVHGGDEMDQNENQGVVSHDGFNAERDSGGNPEEHADLMDENERNKQIDEDKAFDKDEEENDEKQDQDVNDGVPEHLEGDNNHERVAGVRGEVQEDEMTITNTTDVVAVNGDMPDSNIPGPSARESRKRARTEDQIAVDQNETGRPPERRIPVVSSSEDEVDFKRPPIFTAPSSLPNDHPQTDENETHSETSSTRHHSANFNPSVEQIAESSGLPSLPSLPGLISSDHSNPDDTSPNLPMVAETTATQNTSESTLQLTNVPRSEHQSYQIVEAIETESQLETKKAQGHPVASEPLLVANSSPSAKISRWDTASSDLSFSGAMKFRGGITSLSETPSLSIAPKEPVGPPTSSKVQCRDIWEQRYQTFLSHLPSQFRQTHELQKPADGFATQLEKKCFELCQQYQKSITVQNYAGFLDKAQALCTEWDEMEVQKQKNHSNSNESKERCANRGKTREYHYEEETERSVNNHRLGYIRESGHFDKDLKIKEIRDMLYFDGGDAQSASEHSFFYDSIGESMQRKFNNLRDKLINKHRKTCDSEEKHQQLMEKAKNIMEWWAREKQERAESLRARDERYKAIWQEITSTTK